MFYILIAAFWIGVFVIDTCHNYIKREKYFKKLYKNIEKKE